MIKRALERSAHGSFQNLIWCRGNSVNCAKIVAHYLSCVALCRNESEGTGPGPPHAWRFVYEEDLRLAAGSCLQVPV